MKNKKRFQECNIFEKIIRYRWYILLPFLFLFEFLFFKNSSKLLWSLLVSEMQLKMHWYYTSDEVKEKILNKIKKKLNI